MNLVLSNEDHPEYGQVTIPFPIPDEEYAHCIEMLEQLEVGGITDRDCHVDEVLDAPPVLSVLEGACVNVDEVDFLARSLDRFTDGEMAKFQGMAVAKGYTDMTDLINLSFCCERATVITDFSDLESTGKSHYLATNGGSDAKFFDHLNGEGVARELIASGEGVITPYGVVYENGLRLEPVYGGLNFPAYADQEYLMEIELARSPGTPADSAPLTLFLPTPEARLDRLLERAGILDVECVKLKSWYSELPDEVDQRLSMTHEELHGLNRLCEVIRPMDQAQRKKLEAVAVYAKPEDAFQIRQLAENLDLFDFVEDIHTAEDYGRYLIQESGHYEFDENLARYYDYDKCGREQMESETGGYTEMGYVSYHGTMTLEELMMEDPAEQAQREEQGQMMGGLI